MTRTPTTLMVLAGAAVTAIIGCSRTSEPRATTSGPEATTASIPSGKKSDEHAHKPSAHGGIVVPIGRDNYHAEAVFEKGGFLKLYMLGQDESKVQEIEAQPLTAYVKAEGDMEAASFVLRPEPQSGDQPGMTSMFLGHLPKDLVGKKLEVTVPSIRIGADRFRIAFSSAADSAHGDAPMPEKVADDAERTLYLKPGGSYTDADIKANGSVTATEKFKGLKAEHDLKPKSGDKICPITLTKANPKFSWIVGGKSYEFCCPPCVDEFVALAKEKPSEIKDPEHYRKK